MMSGLRMEPHVTECDSVQLHGNLFSVEFVLGINKTAQNIFHHHHLRHRAPNWFSVPIEVLQMPLLCIYYYVPLHMVVWSPGLTTV